MPSIITIIKILIKGRREVDKDDIRTEAEVKGKRRCYAAGFEDRKESQAKNAGGLWKLEKARKEMDSSLSLQKKCRPANTLILAQ